MWIKGKVYLTDTEFTERIVYLKNYMWARFIRADIDSEEQKLFDELYDALQLALDTWNARAEVPALENRLKHLLKSEVVRMYDERDPKNPGSYARDIAELDHLIFDSKHTEKTAHWDINTDGFYPFCSHCGEAAQHMTPHCPNCGAKMITRRHDE